MSLTLLFVLAALSTWRLTRIITGDTISEPYRDQLRAVVPDDRPWYRSRAGYLLNLVECPYCMGVWLGAAFAAWLDLLVGLPLPLLWWGGFAAVAGLLGGCTE